MKLSTLRSNRGSALLIAVVFSAVLLALVASFFALVNSNLRNSNRSYNYSAVMNLAESGLEEGMWAINQVHDGIAPATAYKAANWVYDAGSHMATGTFNDVFAQGSKVKVVVTNCDLQLPQRATMRAQATQEIPGQGTVEKWVNIVLANYVQPPTHNTSKIPPFKGIVAGDKIVLSGNNASADSWDSSADKNSDGKPDAYSSSSPIRNDQVFVGSTGDPIDLVNVNNGDIFGYVATNQDKDLTNNVKSQGSILGYDSASKGYTWIDFSRTSTDFNMDLPDVKDPTPSVTSGSTTYDPTINLGTISAAIELPRSSDMAAETDSYGRPVYYYKASSISLTQGNISIKPGTNVVLTSPTVKISGKGGIVINVDPTAGHGALNLYSSGNVDIAGQGVLNGGDTADTMGKPIDFAVYGTAQGDGSITTNEQSISITGNGVFSGIIYAPNAQLQFGGNGGAFGAVVGNDVTINGNGAFHYDESLGKIIPPNTIPIAQSTTELKLLRWRELQGAERTFTF